MVNIWYSNIDLEIKPIPVNEINPHLVDENELPKL